MGRWERDREGSREKGKNKAKRVGEVSQGGVLHMNMKLETVAGNCSALEQMQL